MDERQSESWHLSKTVNISHLFTTVVLVIGMVSYIGDIERNVAIQHTEISNIKQTMSDHRSSYDSMFGRIDKKLDKLFDALYAQQKN